MNPAASDPQAPQPELVASRRYDTAFSEVWDALLRALGSFRRWEVRESDSRAGTVAVTTTNALGRLPREATFTLRLDELGQTCLEVYFQPATHLLLGPAAAARARRLIRRVERTLEERGRS